MNEHPRDEERLRALLEDAVSDVEPRHGLDSIRSRTKLPATGSRRPWILGAGAAVAATAAAIVAVALVGSDAPSAGPSHVGPAAGSSCPSWPKCPASAGTSPDAAAGTTASVPPPAPASRVIPVYYVGNTPRGPRLYREFHPTPALPTDAAAAQAVHEALARAANDPDYASLWPRGSDVQHVEKSGGTIVVDLKGAALLHDRPAGMSQKQARISLEQLIYTVQAAYQDRAPVRFLLDGKPTDTVLGEPTSEPLAQGAASDVLAQVWIIDPAQGAHVHSGFKVDGLAAAFEANVQWELERGGTVVKKGFTTARECCTMAPYSFTVDAPPGDYTLVVHDEDPSGGEGPGPWTDTKDVTITP